MSTLIRITFVVTLLAAVLVIANPWRDHSEGSPTEPDIAPRRGVEGALTDARVAAGGTRDAESPTERPSTTTVVAEPAATVSRELLSAEQDLAALVAGIDPLLRERNVLTRREDLERFKGLEVRFSTEVADANWSKAMEARILNQISQVIALELVALDAECRESVCRVKLFYPPGTDALSSLETFRPIGREIGFVQVVGVATIGEDGVPISLLYFEREEI